MVFKPYEYKQLKKIKEYPGNIWEGEGQLPQFPINSYGNILNHLIDPKMGNIFQGALRPERLNLAKAIATGLFGKELPKIHEQGPLRGHYIQDMYERGIIPEKELPKYEDLQNHIEHVMRHIKHSGYDLSDINPEALDYIKSHVIANPSSIEEEHLNEIMNNVMDKY